MTATPGFASPVWIARLRIATLGSCGCFTATPGLRFLNAGRFPTL
jgi:hypothetical protein